jgi:hypothetical protein
MITAAIKITLAGPNGSVELDVTPEEFDLLREWFNVAESAAEDMKNYSFKPDRAFAKRLGDAAIEAGLYEEGDHW